jgi:hypothetical protein
LARHRKEKELRVAGSFFAFLSLRILTLLKLRIERIADDPASLGSPACPGQRP